MVLKWLLPLGFIGLIGILILILIYIIKPKYKQKIISSTFVWKLSLKYNKKRVPIDIFRNILLFICQALILSLCAFVLAKPHIFSENIVNMTAERVVILDSSANMRAKYAGSTLEETRFDRAIKDIKMSVDDILFEDNGLISIILADKAPRYLVDGASKEQYSDVVTALDSVKCSYGLSNMETAIEMAQERLSVNPSAKVWIYSGAEYNNLGNAVTLVNLSDTSQEWNIAILGCKTAIEENEFVFYIDVALYGNISTKRTMYVEIKGAENGDGQLKNYPALEVPVIFDADINNDTMETTQTLVVRATDTTIGGDDSWYFSSFEEVNISFKGLNDSLADDNSLKVYGGCRDDIKVQYCSSDANSFFYLGFHVLQNNMRNTRNISFNQIGKEDTPKIEGSDFYIFEHNISKEIANNGIPKDGVVLISDPDKNINNFNVEFGETITLPDFTYLSGGDSHPIMQYISPERIGISKYTKLNSIDDEEFKVLLYCGEDPVMLVKDTPTERIILMLFSINQSNFYGREFQTFLYNIVNYYMPYTITQYEFEIDDVASVNCKGSYLTVENPDGNMINTVTTFPTEIVLDEIGTYVLTTHFSHQKAAEVRKIFVKIPSSESSIFKTCEMHVQLNNEELYEVLGQDIYVWFAALIVLLLFVEWGLHFKEIS